MDAGHPAQPAAHGRHLLARFIRKAGAKRRQAANSTVRRRTAARPDANFAAAGIQRGADQLPHAEGCGIHGVRILPGERKAGGRCHFKNGRAILQNAEGSVVHGKQRAVHPHGFARSSQGGQKGVYRPLPAIRHGKTGDFKRRIYL